MDGSAATFKKLYQNSPNFTSITREKIPDLTRTISPELIPTTSKNILKKDPNEKSFRNEFRFTHPIDIYKSIISDSRSSLPYSEILMKNINVMYNSIIDINMNAIYKYSPQFFINNFYMQTYNSIGNKQYVKNQENFERYEKYIYLLCLIYYINRNKDSLRGQLNKDADAIINWAQIRNNDAIGYILSGPNSTYEIPGDFVSHYKLLLSSANAIQDLAVQNQLAKTDLLYSEITNFHTEMNNRPNSYDKLVNEAKQYFLILKDEEGLKTEIDDQNNLIFDASYLDIGEINDKNINGDYFSIIVEQGKFINPPSKISYKSLLQLFNQFNSISIHKLEFDYSVFKNDISKFNELYLVFPGIKTSEHTINGSFPRGTLIIGGKFVNNSERRRYEFIPNEPITTFDGSQTKVENFNFYITNNYKGKNSIISNNLIMKFNKEDVYNHLLTSNITSKINSKFSLETYSNQITYKFPDTVDQLNNRFINYLHQIEFIPKFILDYLNNSEINSDVFNSFMKLLKQLSKFHKYQKMNLNLPNRQQGLSNLIFNLQTISDNSAYKSLIGNIVSQIFNYESFRNCLIQIINLNIELFMNKSVELLTNQDLINYSEKLMKTVSFLSPLLTINPEKISIDIDPNTGLIDNKLFNHSEYKLEFVYEISDANIYKFVSNEENNISLIRFFNNSLELIPSSVFLFAKQFNESNIVQKLPFEVENVDDFPSINIFNTGTVVKINKLFDDENNFILAGGDTEVDVKNLDLTTDLYANITEYSETFQIVDYWFNNSNNKLKFIKYIPNKILNSEYFRTINPDLYLFHNEYTDESGKIYLIIVNLNRSLIIYNQTDNQEINIYRDLNFPFNIQIEINDFIKISNNSFEYKFYIDSELLVSSFEINKFSYENILIPWTKTTIVPDYQTVSNVPGIEISTAEISYINDDSENNTMIKIFKEDNIFKAYYSFNDLQSEYWKSLAYATSILINPIIETPKIKNKFTGNLIINSNLLTCIYSVENKIKKFHSIVLITPTNIITNNSSKDNLNEDVFVYEILNNLFQSDSIVYSNENLIKVLIINSKEESMIVEIELNFEKQFINRLTIINNSNGKSLTIYGNIQSEYNYSFDSNKLDDEYLGLGNFSISYIFESGTLKISEINVSLIGARLRKFSIEDGEVYESKLFNYYFNLNSKLPNLESTGLISLENTNNFEYQAILPLCKYHQNNLESEIFASNGGLKMVINNLDSSINNKYITIKKDISNKDSNQDVFDNHLNIADSIPSIEKYLSENLDNKLVINNINNKLSNEKITISPDFGLIDLMGNNLMNLSLNFK